MKHRKTIVDSPSFIQLTINSWKYNLDGIDKEEVPQEVFYGASQEYEEFIKKCCDEFKQHFEKELIYEFRHNFCFLRFKDTIITPKKLFELSDIDISSQQKAIVSKKLEIMMEKYVRFSLKNPDENAYFEGVADGLNTAYKIINGIEDDYIFKN